MNTGSKPLAGGAAAPRFGLTQRLAAAVVIAISAAAAAICVVLFLFSQQRSYEEAARRSEQMVLAASMAFARALAANDEVLLDAYVHELGSRPELAIGEIYVLDRDGRVAAHTELSEYGRSYPKPALLAQTPPPRLSEVLAEDDRFRVVSLLQAKGEPIGVLSAAFSLAPLRRKLWQELAWIAAVTLPILALAGAGLFAYGRRITARLARLKAKAAAVGRGEWDEPLPADGADEIGALTLTFNQMLADLAALRGHERRSAETIAAQLERIKQLKEQLAEENATLRNRLQSMSGAEPFIGANGSFKYVLEQARQLASLPVTVLISGESGTGKELLAHYLHDAGVRRGEPFVSVNCAALPVNLIESELFGHEKGAFTGAVGQKAGKFELAAGGTLFLDEVSELPLEAQAKLLRALQEGEIQRVGGDRAINVDTRVIAASNRELEREVAAGKFRADLYYRLNVVQLRLPPLRERLEDVPALVQHFIGHYSKRLQKPVLGVSPTALERLMAWPWPGNIRELENVVARAVALATTQVLGPDDFLFGARHTAAPVAEAEHTPAFERLLALCGLSRAELRHGGWARLVGTCERLCIEGVLPQHRSQKEAAEALGLTPTKLHRLLRKHRIKV